MALATLFLIFAGGMVTSTGSGLAVPDWPLSYGMLFPPMVGGIFYEHGHRMIAGVVGLLIGGLAIWLLRSEPRRWVRRLGVAAALAVLVQAVATRPPSTRLVVATTRSSCRVCRTAWCGAS